jgi:alpha-1,2-mannosyltransferase
MQATLATTTFAIVLRRAPDAPRRTTAATAVLFGASLTGWITLVVTNPDRYWRQGDALVYRAAGAAVWHGEPLYPALFGPAHLPFTYPPFAGLLFAPVSVVPFRLWQIALAALSISALLVASFASLRLAGCRAVGGAFALAAIAMWLEPVDLTLHFGQLNLILLAAVLGDLAAMTGRARGVALGVAAGIKLTPLILVPYLWFTGRRRTAGVAAAAFAGTVALGVLVIPDDAVRYWTHWFWRPGDGPDRLVNQSLEGFILRLDGRASGDAATWLLIAIAVAAIGLTAAVVAATRGHELLGICVCAATGLLISPISWTHHWVWVVPALALTADRRLTIGVRVVCAAAIVALFGWWPAPAHEEFAAGPTGVLRLAPHDHGRELHWTVWQLTYGDGYVLAALAFVLGVGAWLVVRRTADWRRT